MLKSHYYRRILGYIILLAALAISAVIIRYFMSIPGKEKNRPATSVSTDIAMQTIHYTESQNDRKSWELFAQNGSYDKTKENTSLEDIRFIVERHSNKGPVTVTAKNGEYLHLTKTVHLRGSVLATTENGMKFETSQIDFDSAKKTFTTKEKVRLTDAALTVEGIGMELFVDSQQAVVKSRVEATVYPGKRIQ